MLISKVFNTPDMSWKYIIVSQGPDSRAFYLVAYENNICLTNLLDHLS